MCLDFIDVVWACFRARVRREVYVELITRGNEEQGARGLLRRVMCGTRDAA